MKKTKTCEQCECRKRIQRERRIVNCSTLAVSDALLRWRLVVWAQLWAGRVR